MYDTSGTLLVRLYKDAVTPSSDCSFSSNSVMDHLLGNKLMPVIMIVLKNDVVFRRIM